MSPTPAMKALAKAVREYSLPISDSHSEAAELIRVLSRIVEGKSLDRAFGAPGDWGYGTPIGDAVYAMLQEPLPSDTAIEWHYTAEGDLPEPDTTCLVAIDNPESDEVVCGSYDGDGGWLDDLGLAIDHTVYAWAHAPSKPEKRAKKGGSK